MKTIRWGIIGCGDVCEVKSGPALYKTLNSELVAVMRRDGEKAADFAKRHNVPKSYDDADRIIHDPDIDIVYVATPPGSHRDYALRIAEAGKHCYVEKPMARNAAEARQMVEAFKGAGRKLFVAYYRRVLPVFVRAKRLVDEGAIGNVTGILHRHCSPSHRRQGGWRLNAADSGGGLFVDLASHVFDALDYITGPFTNASGRAANLASSHDVEDVVSVSWQSERGAVGASLWNFASDIHEDRIELYGTEGKLAWSSFGSPIVALTKGKETTEFNEPYPAHVHQPLVQTIVDELNGTGNCPSTGVTATRTQAVMDQCLTSFYGGRDDAFWERSETWPGQRRS